MRTNWTPRARRGEGSTGPDTFSFIRFHTRRRTCNGLESAAVMAQVSPVWKVFKIHASISTPVRQMEDLPNSFHASTWQRANGKPLEGGLGVGGGDWRLVAVNHNPVDLSNMFFFLTRHLLGSKLCLVKWLSMNRSLFCILNSACRVSGQ